MGQKVQPTGFRLGITENWRSRWYADKDYATTLKNDLELRSFLEKDGVQINSYKELMPRMNDIFIKLVTEGEE